MPGDDEENDAEDDERAEYAATPRAGAGGGERDAPDDGGYPGHYETNAHGGWERPACAW